MRIIIGAIGVVTTLVACVIAIVANDPLWVSGALAASVVGAFLTSWVTQS